MTRKLLCLIYIAVIGLVLPDASHAGFDYGFYNITQNDPTNKATGEAQLKLAVSDAGSGLVRFLFTNVGPLASSIADIYFDDRKLSLFSPPITSLEEGAGVDYGYLAKPENLPGGQTANFESTSQLSADSEAPTQPNGVNPGESLGVVLTLSAGKAFDNVIAALQSASLRVGIHVQGFENGGSESFINMAGTDTPPPPVVPEPSSLVLVGTALVGMTIARRRRPAA